jgi:hypothetical protein
MTIEKSFEWLFKRFANQNIKPCAFDIECLKFLAEWVNREKQTVIRENELFAKLYCHVFIQEIKFYKDFEFAQKSMNDILNLPIEMHYVLFTQRLNDYELNRYLLSLGIDTEKSIFEDNTAELEKANKEAFIKFTTGKWSEEQTRKSLNAQITESLNRFKNNQL